LVSRGNNPRRGQQYHQQVNKNRSKKLADIFGGKSIFKIYQHFAFSDFVYHLDDKNRFRIKD
jgi:hypothetical protein